MMDIKKILYKILPAGAYNVLRKFYFDYFIYVTIEIYCIRGKIASRLENLKLKRNSCDYEIDFVITWVDSNDIEWQNEKAKYSDNKKEGDNVIWRYRDWDTLAFWLRAIEKYAPWVRKVFFVTCGQKPEWLDEKNEKLVLVSHSDFIPKKYLPTFSCDPIELNLWRIADLSEHFVYFNDDVFLNHPVEPSDFFCNGLPKLCPVAKPVYPSLTAVSNDSQKWNQRVLNDIGVINTSFNIRQQMKRYYSKWFSYKLKQNSKYSKRLYFDGYCSGIENQHSVYPILKSEMKDLWECQYALLDETSITKFRTPNDVTLNLATLWMIFKGSFYSVNDGYYGTLYIMGGDSAESIVTAIVNDNDMIVCVNDSDKLHENDIDTYKNALKEAFLRKFPEKSSFELYDHIMKGR